MAAAPDPQAKGISAVAITANDMRPTRKLDGKGMRTEAREVGYTFRTCKVTDFGFVQRLPRYPPIKCR